MGPLVRSRAAWLLLFCGYVTGCATIDLPVEDPQQPQPIVAGEESLTDAAAERVLQTALRAYATDPGVPSLVNAVRRHASEPLTAGNEVAVLVDGPATFEAIRSAISSARHHVHIESFIFGGDEVGQQFADLLAEKRREGVEVRVLYDSIGSMDTPDSFFDQMRGNGIEVREYSPINPFENPRIWDVHNRDHRKIILVDGRIGFTGGINIDNTYSKASKVALGPERGLADGWRDTHVRIQGPAVAQLQELFTRVWNEVGDDVEFGNGYFPQVESAGDALITIVANDHNSTDRSLYATVLAGFSQASSRLWVTQAYFVPNDALLQAMVDAVDRGVDVRLIVPSFSDSNIVLQATKATYSRLLKGGVRIFERQSALLHAKSIVIDGVVSFIGSANLDMRSFLHNNEVYAIVVSRDIGQQMELVFERDQQLSRELELARWKQRSTWQRLKEFFTQLVGYWL